ncbi:MAG: hypothetical protein LBQ31_08695 [Bacteroidales bacterium]|jgi:hypothetical protein|nr:hypothetical protein [Bacteroidales bacterium]
MTSIEICISFIVVILGVAYPVLFQVISNLGEKYDSVLLVSIFKRECEYRIFQWLLYITLGIILIYILAGITRAINVSWLIEVSEVLIIVFTAILIVSFFSLVRKILIYYNRNDLTSYFINRDKDIDTDSDNRDDFTYFESIAELFYWSIKNQNEHIAKTISDYFYACFRKFREKPVYSQLGYPDQYYKVVYKATLELLRLNDNKLIFLEIRIPGGIWLLGEYVTNKIPEKTYSYLWINLVSCIEHKRDDIILSYWQTAFQYFSYSLRSIDRRLSKDYENVLNKPQIEEREKERECFLEFNFALGGLLLYQERYECIHRMFRFTQSEPPNYVLFPQTMREVFNLFLKFSDSYSKEMSWISRRYSFPNTEGLEADGIVRNWIRRYIAVLFLRQYTLLKYYTSQNHVTAPSLPDSQEEKRFWLNNIDYFKNLVLELCSNKKLMSGLKFDLYEDFSNEWCSENGKLPIADLFEKTKGSLIESIKITEKEQEPSDSKIKQFEKSTNRIVSSVFDSYKKLVNSNKVSENYHSWYSRGVQSLINKNSFVENQDITYLNIDSFLAEDYARELNHTISQQFHLKKNKSYLLDKEKLFKGIDYLKIRNPNKYLIIAFDLYLPYFEGTDGLDIIGNKYKEIEICEINSFFYPLRQSLIVIRKTDLPYFHYQEIDSIIKEKYELNEINKTIKLYASVVDLNKKKDLWEEMSKIKEVDLSTQVLLRIELSTEFRWKKDIDVVQIKLFSIYEENGIPNKLKDVQPINKVNGYRQNH